MDLNTGELFADTIAPNQESFESRRNRQRVLKSLKEIGDAIPQDTEAFDPGKVNVFIIGHTVWEQNLFRNNGYRIVYDVSAAHMVVWLGGEDISPALYGETPIKEVRRINLERDAQELKFWRQSQGKFKAGICRGGQLLNVLNGGKLWQHVEGHSGQHDMVDLSTGQIIRTSSVHHQAFIPTPEAEIVATATVSTLKENERSIWRRAVQGSDGPDAVDYEVVYYPETRSLCFQGHPEYTDPPGCSKYFFSLLTRYYPQLKQAA